LAGAEWLCRPETQAVFRALAAAGYPAMAVGGVVRNALMGLPVTDIDIATPAPPDRVAAAARAAGLDCVPTGIDHGTVTVVANRMPFEVTTLRRDVATDGRRATVAFTDDWAEDAARRDFTINALYCASDGRILDPLGGYPDIRARRVRFIGDPDRRIAEDYLRILRYFRFFATFAAGDPDGSAIAACIRARRGLERLSAERVRAELLKLLVAPRAVAAVDAMTGAGLLARVLHLAPRPGLFQRLCAAEAAMGVPPDAILRLSALAVAVEEDAAALTERLRLSNAESRALMVLDARTSHALAAGDDRAARRLLAALGPVEWRPRVLAAMASGLAPDRAGRWLSMSAALPVPDFPLRGADLLDQGLTSGPAVGALLAELRQWWIEADFPSEDCLRARLKDRLARG